MNNEQVTEANAQPEWTATKARIQAKFSKLSAQNVDSLKDNMDQLSSKLQTVYGYPKDQADQESTAFRTSLSTPDNVKTV